MVKKTETAPKTENGKKGSGEKKKKIKIVFDNEDVKCPRCGANDTVPTSTQGIVQYRKCVRPICRWHFKQTGKKVEL